MKYLIALLMMFMVGCSNNLEPFSLHKDHDVFVEMPLKSFGHNKLYCVDCQMPIKESRLTKEEAQ